MPSGHTVLRKAYWDDTKKDFTDVWNYTVEDAAVMGQVYVISPSLDENLRKHEDDLKHFLDVFTNAVVVSKRQEWSSVIHNHDLNCVKSLVM